MTVRDTGIGIAPSVLPHIFDRFRQAESTITRRHGGLGLGLAIVRHLVELHGGVVSVQSPGPGQGATFSVRLPVAAPTSRGRVTPITQTSVPEMTARSALNGMRVLVAEDHGDTADLMRTVLQGQGAVVHIVDSIGAALAALANSDIDVLISDIGMPDGTGYDLMARMRDRGRMSGRTAPPAVAVTASRAPTTASGRWPPAFKAGRPSRSIPHSSWNRWPRPRGPARSPLSRLHHHSSPLRAGVP